MSESDGLIHAYRLDGKGGGAALDWADLKGGTPDAAPSWLYLDRTDEDARKWLQESADLDPVVCEALLAEDARPRCLGVGEGLLVILRGVNLNPGADPEDMVSIRMWIDSHRLIAVRRQPVIAVRDVETRLKQGKGARDTGDLLVDIAARLIERVGPVVGEVDDQVDELEDLVMAEHDIRIRKQIGELRRTAISLRRYLAPQREVMAQLVNEPCEWLSRMQRARLRETGDRVIRYIEDLDSARDRAAVTMEELASLRGEQMNRTMYVLSIVAAIFLPLGLLTGLLGINVGGIPGTDEPLAFLAVCILLAVLAVAEVLLLRRMHWM